MRPRQAFDEQIARREAAHESFMSLFPENQRQNTPEAIDYRSNVANFMLHNILANRPAANIKPGEDPYLSDADRLIDTDGYGHRLSDKALLVDELKKQCGYADDYGVDTQLGRDAVTAHMAGSTQTREEEFEGAYIEQDGHDKYGIKERMGQFGFDYIDPVEAKTRQLDSEIPGAKRIDMYNQIVDARYNADSKNHNTQMAREVLANLALGNAKAGSEKTEFISHRDAFCDKGFPTLKFMKVSALMRQAGYLDYQNGITNLGQVALDNGGVDPAHTIYNGLTEYSSATEANDVRQRMRKEFASIQIETKESMRGLGLDYTETYLPEMASRTHGGRERYQSSIVWSDIGVSSATHALKDLTDEVAMHQAMGETTMTEDEVDTKDKGSEKVEGANQAPKGVAEASSKKSVAPKEQVYDEQYDDDKDHNQADYIDPPTPAADGFDSIFATIIDKVKENKTTADPHKNAMLSQVVSNAFGPRTGVAAPEADDGSGYDGPEY